MKMTTLFLSVLVLGFGILHAEPRHALVVGTWDYDDPTYPPLPAKGGAADVAKMKEALTSLGFTVSVVTNPSLKAAKKAVDDFGAVIKKEPGTALFYFTGHGSEYDGKNFLIPTGTTIRSNRDLDDEALSANRVLARMEESGGAVNIVFLDCCRNSLSMAGGDGMAPMKVKGSFIGYATRSGKTAQTTTSGSYYTSALVKHLGTPGLSIDDMHTLVVKDVKAADPSQNPGKYSELDELFYFAGVGGSPNSATPMSDMLKMSSQELELWVRKFGLESKRITRGHRTTTPWEIGNAFGNCPIAFESDVDVVIFEDEVKVGLTQLQGTKWEIKDVANMGGPGWTFNPELQFVTDKKTQRRSVFIAKGRSVKLAQFMPGEYVRLAAVDEKSFDPTAPAFMLAWTIPAHPAIRDTASSGRVDPDQTESVLVDSTFYFLAKKP